MAAHYEKKMPENGATDKEDALEDALEDAIEDAIEDTAIAVGVTARIIYTLIFLGCGSGSPWGCSRCLRGQCFLR